MSRKLIESQSGDSLDLLLDTLTNVFGVVILIACLLAILPRGNTSPLLPAQEARSQMVERRIETTRRELARAQAEIQTLATGADPALAAEQSRRDSLQRSLDRLMREESVLTDTITTAAELRALATNGDPAAMQSALTALQARESEAATAAAATRAKTIFLKERLGNLTAEAGELAKGKINQLRFPRERRGKLGPFPVIVSGNAIFPLQIGRNLDDNPAVGRLPIAGQEAFRAAPKPGVGMTAKDGAVLLATLAAAKNRGCYITVYLYPDSHAAFADLKAIIHKADVPYGLEFVAASRALNFGEEGTTPPEL